MVATMQFDKLRVTVFDSSAALGRAAADNFAEIVTQAVAAHGETSVILATGNAQFTFFAALREKTDIPWNKISVFHMDEYLGLRETHPGSFRLFLRENILDAVHPKMFYGMGGDAADVQAELARYSELLKEYQPVLCVMGIGENGHIAFNDPPADFQTREIVHVVSLDDACRRQQVGEGHFPTFDDVPKQALSLTVHGLLQPAFVMALVPEARKAQAVKAALEGPITETCPASILRTQAHVHLYLDRDSFGLVQPLS